MSLDLTKTFHSAATAAENGASAGVSDLATYGVQIDGISGDTITFEATIDGANWVAVLAKNANTGASGTTATADGIYLLSVSGFGLIRCRISTYSAGAITVTGVGTYAPLGSYAPAS